MTSALKKKIPKFVPLGEIEDRVDCVNRNVARLEPDISQIVHEELKSVVEEPWVNESTTTDHRRHQQARRRERPYSNDSKQ